MLFRWFVGSVSKYALQSAEVDAGLGSHKDDW